MAILPTPRHLRLTRRSADIALWNWSLTAAHRRSAGPGGTTHAFVNHFTNPPSAAGRGAAVPLRIPMRLRTARSMSVAFLRGVGEIDGGHACDIPRRLDSTMSVGGMRRGAMTNPSRERLPREGCEIVIDHNGDSLRAMTADATMDTSMPNLCAQT